MLQAARNRLSCKSLAPCSTLPAQAYLQSQASLCEVVFQVAAGFPRDTPGCEVPSVASPGLVFKTDNCRRPPSGGNHSLTLAKASQAE